MVQVLTDLNLIIRRAYISSDGEWFMDGNNLFLFLFFLIFVFGVWNSLFSVIFLVLLLFLVFHVTDQNGKKLCDDGVGERIQQVHLKFRTLKPFAKVKTQISIEKLSFNLIEFDVMSCWFTYYDRFSRISSCLRSLGW